VKYAQCVKIWPFDVLILFLKCVQFLKPCVQFLMDTILNPAIVKFLMKKKGDVHYGACLLCQEKGDACCGGHVSYLRKRETLIMGARVPFT
jgi:hypothetical protein